VRQGTANPVFFRFNLNSVQLSFYTSILYKVLHLSNAIKCVLSHSEVKVTLDPLNPFESLLGPS